ncbi:uncharacterized protein BXZ73DRAFT_11944, partial [Epithele typhae]|uniref:uncharacterized protein n=1 Tax=Epithele typhae TaxID=378194 RepID=UPI002007DC59
ILKDATLFFSRKEANLGHVLASMEHIRTTLQGDKKNYSPAISMAFKAGLKTFEKYYYLTDSSDLYRIAMVLNPRYKLSYAQTDLKYTQSWVT